MLWPGPVIALAALAALAAALALRPWRGLSAAGPPWPWLAWCTLLPLSWAVRQLSHETASAVGLRDRGLLKG